VSSKFKICISTVLFDLYGFIELATLINQNDITINRRVNSVKTLNASAYVSDFGYSIEDTELNYQLVEFTKDYYENLIRLAKNYSEFVLTNANGAFVVVIRSIRVRAGILNINFVVKGAA